MKKWIAILLVAVMGLSLVACGGDNGSKAEKAMLGAWNREGAYDVLLFSADGKVTRGDDTYDRWYDTASGRYCVSLAGLTYTFVLEEDENGRFFAVDGVRLYHVENYDPEKMKAEYIQKQIASITEGKTELVVGNTYTTESGVVFKLDKVEIQGDDECWFDLYIECETALEMEDESYQYFGGRSSFGIGWQPEGSEGNTHRYAGCSFKSPSQIAAHRETYGFLCFTIEETAYYIPVNTFYA